MGRIVKSPGKKVGGCEKDSGENGGAREVGNAGADIAGQKESETGEGEEREKVVAVLAVPAPRNDDVGGEDGDIKGADYIHEGGEVEDHVEDDDGGGDEGQGQGGSDSKNRNDIIGGVIGGLLLLLYFFFCCCSSRPCGQNRTEP